jgi:hypothetical protein
MKLVFLSLLLAFISGEGIAEEAATSACLESSKFYEQQYERTRQTSDMDCYLKAFERERSGPEETNKCPLSAERYRLRFSQSGSPDDLACYEQALRSESE